MKAIAVLLAMVGTCTAALQWLHIIYRIQLFVSDYGCQRGVNPIGDGEFVLFYLLHGFFALALAFAARALWKEPGRWRSVACWAGAAHAAACLALLTMYSTGVLVEYSGARSDWDMISRQDFPSPDGRHVATVFEMCSYNTTGYWPQLSLLRPGQRLGTDGNVLAGGPGDSFTVRWISARELAVEYLTYSEWPSYPPSTRKINGVTITFKKL